MSKKRVLVVANKWWECDPILNVLLHANAAPKDLKWTLPLNYPRPRPDKEKLPVENNDPQPRVVFHLPNIEAEVWCISDLLEHLLDESKYQSSSEQKILQLPKIFKRGDADFVIAAGTAGYSGKYTENGSVVVGSRIFMHNSHPNGENPDSKWDGGPFDQVIESKVDQNIFNEITTIETSPVPSVLDRFIVPPLNPVATGRLIARHDHVALGSVNVTKYTEYTETDTATVQAFCAQNNISSARSLETTHGLIRIQSDAPFIFVSGITDRVGHFDDEVNPRSYAQNTVAAHNAGIVIAWLLPRLDKYI